MLESQRAADSRTTGERQADLQVAFYLLSLILQTAKESTQLSSSPFADVLSAGAVQGDGDVHRVGDQRTAREGLGPCQLLLQRGKRPEEGRRELVKSESTPLDMSVGL